jgi:hypothetical protein
MENKENFINSEFWVLTIMGAFGRAKVYRPDVPVIEKKYFKRLLKGHLDTMIESCYFKSISQKTHIENIKEVMRFSESTSDILTNGNLNFGVAQKLLNLYLKYHWCLGLIPTPPHFPVDSIIQKELGLKIVPWTKMENEIDYLRIINHAKTLLENHDCKTIAELELLLFRRNN